MWSLTFNAWFQRKPCRGERLDVNLDVRSFFMFLKKKGKTVHKSQESYKKGKEKHAIANLNEKKMSTINNKKKCTEQDSVATRSGVQMFISECGMWWRNRVPELPRDWIPWRWGGHRSRHPLHQEFVRRRHLFRRVSGRVRVGTAGQSPLWGLLVRSPHRHPYLSEICRRKIAFFVNFAN